MSDKPQVPSTTTAGNGNSEGSAKPGVYKFSVDGRPYESEAPVLAGAQIKARAGVDPSFLLYLEAHGGAPDQQIADATSVDLRDIKGREQFYSAPPATFGGECAAAVADPRLRAGSSR
jgi:hypothetical protein